MGWYTLGAIVIVSYQLPTLHLRSSKAVHKPSQALFTQFKTNLAAITHSAVAELITNTYKVVILRLVTALVTNDINQTKAPATISTNPRASSVIVVLSSG